MPDWLMGWLGQVQGGIVRTLAAELRAGGAGTALLALTLGALHALTPGHGKAALAAYFLGRDAHIGKGLRITLSAAMLHVLSGLAVFVVLRLILGQMPSMFGRNSPALTVIGYALIVIAGAVMLVQSWRPSSGHGDGATALTAGIGLLPCPLTISVLGFAWAQSNAAMVGLVLVSLALGISVTIGGVALAAIVARRSLGAALGRYMPALDRGSRMIQAGAGLLMIAIGVWTIVALLR